MIAGQPSEATEADERTRALCNYLLSKRSISLVTLDKLEETSGMRPGKYRGDGDAEPWASLPNNQE